MKKVLLCLALSPSLVFAEVPNKFTAGTAAKAAEVNANFSHTEAKADANATVIAENVTAIAGNKTSAATNATSITSLTTATETNGTNIETLVADVEALASQTALDDITALVGSNTLSVEGLTTTVSTLATQANLDAALDKIAALEAAPTDSPLSKLEGGEISFDVDCTNDPAALLTTYQANLIYSNVNFKLTGQCYGNIDDIRGADTGGIQIGGQTIGIRSKDPENRATIIPNDETGSSFLYPGISGGLYLNDIDIQAGASESMLVLFSRNSHGSLINVNITGDSGTWAGVMVQEGGQVYIQGTNISGPTTGIFARNNGTVRFLGANTIDVVNYGIELFNSSTVNQQGDVSVSVSDGHAVKLEGGSLWKGSRNLVTTGNVIVNAGSTLDIPDLNISAGNLDLQQATVVVGNMVNIEGDVYLSQSKMAVHGQTNVSGGTALNNGSSAQFNEPNMATLEVNNSVANINSNGNTLGYFIDNINLNSSTLDISGVDYTHLGARHNSTVQAFDSVGTEANFTNSHGHFYGESDVTLHLSADHSTLLIDNAAISATNQIFLTSSKARVWGENINTGPEKFSCNGMSVLEIDGWVRYDGSTVDDSTNCADRSVWDSLLDKHAESLRL